uniref:Uncharacterized protein n=1 Tax=Takifugu rubripes TaxID=31033 RepID=A0A674MZN5_TAKRU
MHPKWTLSLEFCCDSVNAGQNRKVTALVRGEEGKYRKLTGIGGRGTRPLALALSCISRRCCLRCL